MRKPKSKLDATRVEEKDPIVVKLSGYANWMSTEPDGFGQIQKLEIESAVLRDNSELVIECRDAPPGLPPLIYTAVLWRQDALFFSGEWSAIKQATPTSGQCSLRLYPHAGQFAFFGTWKGEPVFPTWCGELFPVSGE